MSNIVERAFSVNTLASAPAAVVMSSPSIFAIGRDVKDFHKNNPLGTTRDLRAHLRSVGHDVCDDGVLAEVARAEGMTGGGIAVWVAQFKKLGAPNGNGGTPSLAIKAEANGNGAALVAAEPPPLAESNDDAARMAALFEGSEVAHVTYSAPKREPSGKIRPKYSTVRSAVTAGHWEQHLAGKYPLGIIPIRSDGKCKWGSIDVDEYAQTPLSGPGGMLV